MVLDMDLQMKRYERGKNVGSVEVFVYMSSKRKYLSILSSNGK